MLYLQWSDKLSVNVSEIDGQHKKMVVMLNVLHETFHSKRSREVQKRVICDLISYADLHFRTEERYMEQFDYSDYLTHKEEHSDFREKAADLRERLEKTGLVSVPELLEFMKQWIEDHVRRAYMKYSQHFMSCGLS